MKGKITFHGIVTYEWRHARDLDLEPREIRRVVSQFNDKFGTDNNHRYYIISGQQGYRLTRNKKEIEKAIERAEKLVREDMKRISTRRRNFDRMVKRDWHGGNLYE